MKLFTARGATLAVLLSAFLCGGQTRHACAGTRSSPAEISTRQTIGFRTPALLIEHYRKHGREFGAVSMEEYLRLAQALRDRSVGGPVLEAVRADRVITRYDRKSGAFLAFNQNLTIRTFFRPNQGETYFQRQARR